MKKGFEMLKVTLVILFSVVIVGCSTVDPDVDEMMDPDDMNEGSNLEAAPDFTLTSADGSQVSLKDFAEKPLVIFFFGNTCPLCIGAGPKIQADIREKFTTDEVAMIGIDVWDGNQASVLNFKDRTGVTFDLLLEGSSVASDYKTTYDRLFVLNGKGEFIHKGSSSAGNDIDNVVKAVQDLL
jgi:peroxiredoxin